MQAFIATLRLVFLRDVLRYIVSRGLFKECLQEFISVYALKVSLPILLKAFFNECMQGLIAS